MVSENAKRIEIDLDRFHFFVVKHEKQFFIPTNEGLRLINVNIDWISTLGNRRKRSLERYGFSFKEQLICYEIEGGAFSVAATRGQTGLGFGAISLPRAIVALSVCSGSWLNWVL
jgi:hypothetical protein